YPMLREDLVAGTSSESKYLHEVTIRLDSFSGYAGLRTSEFRKDLQGQGIKLQLEDDGADYGARTKALQRGDAQLAVFTIDAFVSSGAARGEFPGTIVMVIDETYGADAIVAYKSAVPNLQALNNADAQLVLTPGSPSEFLGRVAIAEFGLNDLSTKWVEADGASQVFKQLRKDKQSLKRGYVLWEPFKSQALEDKAVHVLFDTSRVSGYVVDVLVAQRQFLLDHPDVVRSVVEAQLRTMDSYQGRLVQLVIDDAKRTGDSLSQAQAQKVVDGIRWRNTLENYTHFGLAPPAPGILLLEDSISNIADVLVRTGGLGEDPVAGRANELFYQGTLQEMKGSDFHPQKKLGIVDGALGTGDLDSVAGEAELRGLTSAEWEQLTPVGSMQVKAISFGRGTAR
ncbi:MAG: hypothetical protein HN348_34805, partial [Proteobacteria bacterium]|nr:hypothetical protein [Pseudomonadota bacterium]